MQRQASLWMPAMTAGFIFGFLSGIPFIGLLNCLCCALIMGAGTTCSYLLIKASSAPLSTGRAAAGGALSGLFAVPVTGITWSAFHIILGGDLTREFQEAIDQVGENPALAEGAEVLSEVGIYFVISLWAVIAFFCFTLFGMLGGIIGRALFEKRTPAAPAPPVPPAPPAGGTTPSGGPPEEPPTQPPPPDPMSPSS